MIKTVSREIGRYGQFRVSVLVFLINPDTDKYKNYRPGKAFRRYIGQGGASLTYDFPTFIVLDYSMATGTFIKGHKLFVPIMQVHKLIKFLSKTAKIIEDSQRTLYYIDGDHGGRLSMYTIPPEKHDKYIVTAYGIGGSNHILSSHPTIITDYQDNAYEGVTISIDRIENTVDLSYEELEALLYILSRTDFMALSMAMVSSLSIWANPIITKHLNIETVRSSDLKQQKDIIQNEIEQPKVSLGSNVFSELKEVNPRVLARCVRDTPNTSSADRRAILQNAGSALLESGQAVSAALLYAEYNRAPGFLRTTAAVTALNEYYYPKGDDGKLLKPR